MSTGYEFQQMNRCKKYPTFAIFPESFMEIQTVQKLDRLDNFFFVISVWFFDRQLPKKKIQTVTNHC